MSLLPDLLDVPVVVVGAGPTGLTAATLLGLRGVQTLVLDRWGGVLPQPRAVHLDDEVFRVLGDLGLAEQFAAISRPALGLRLLDARHRVLAEFGRDGGAGAHGHPQASMFDQPGLERLLRDNLSGMPSVTLLGDVEVEQVGPDGPDRVRVEVNDRATGRRSAVHARYVLGCDGARSVVRSCLGASMVDLGFAQRWLVVDVRTGADLHQWEGVQQVCDSVRAATYLRVGHDRYRWEFRLLPGEVVDDDATLDRVLPLLRPWTGDLDGHDLELVRQAEYTFRAQVADRWSDGRSFLLGDAAHLTPPFIGQGLGAGLRDASNLVWKVAGVLDGTLPAAALDSYEAERRPHVVHLVRLAILLGVLMTRGGRVGDVARRVLAPRLAWVPGLRARVLDSETPRLRGSSLLVRHGPGRDVVGRLCPNATGEDGRRLDEHAPGRFLLVTDLDLGAGERAEAAERGVVPVAAAGSELGRWLRRHRVGAALVRPDHTVMSAGPTAGQALAALPVTPAGPATAGGGRRGAGRRGSWRPPRGW